MMRSTDRTATLVAIGGSIAAHALLLPVLAQGLESPGAWRAPAADASHIPTPPEEQPDIRLGLSESQTSTLTWIGYREYEQHLAVYAEQEQAAMQVDPLSIPTPVSEPTASTVTPVLAELLQDLSDLGTQLLAAAQSTPIPEPPQPPAPAAIAETPVESKPADPADRDADPTSTIEVPPENWKTGKPVAGEGIQLRPKRPSFTAHQAVTSAPGSMFATLFIDHTGRPIRVEIVEGTGSGSIDRTLKSSLYSWRASGERIDAMSEGETIRIPIEITFGR